MSTDPPVSNSFSLSHIDFSLPQPAENLALDEVLLNEATEILRTWELTGYAVVLGRSCGLSENVREEECSADGVPIFRRCSGGGTVLLGPGCLLYSMVLSLSRPGLVDVRSSYCQILGAVAESLTTSELQITCAGQSDLAIGGMKISGNSQRRTAHALLHHGSLLYEFDLDRVARYLKAPPRQPEYRRKRPHSKFLMNIDLSRPVIIERIRCAFGRGAEEIELPLAEAQQLAESKYITDEWTRRL